MMKWLNDLLANYTISIIMSRLISVGAIVVQFIGTVSAFKKVKEKHQKLVKGLFVISAILMVGNGILTATGLLSERSISEFGDRIYFGQTEGGKANGWGRLFDENHNIVFIGHFKNNQYDQKGNLYINEMVNGKVVCKSAYEGQFSKGNFDGQGKLFEYIQDDWKLIYEGEYLNGEKNGFGVWYQYDDSGKVIEIDRGSFYKDKLFGYAEVAYNFEGVKKRYIGTYVNGQKSGEGTWYEDAEIKYEGEWKKDKYHGKGKIYWKEKDANNDEQRCYYEGQFKNGKVNGQGVAYDEDGNIIWKGKCKDGEPVN